MFWTVLTKGSKNLFRYFFKPTFWTPFLPLFYGFWQYFLAPTICIPNIWHYLQNWVIFGQTWPKNGPKMAIFGVFWGSQKSIFVLFSWFWSKSQHPQILGFWGVLAIFGQNRKKVDYCGFFRYGSLMSVHFVDFYFHF